jgi:hypothetical protein
MPICMSSNPRPYAYATQALLGLPACRHSGFPPPFIAFQAANCGFSATVGSGLHCIGGTAIEQAAEA